MTRDDIIRMMQEAGWSGLYTTFNEPTGNADWKMVKESLTVPVTMEQIERFAARVAQEIFQGNSQHLIDLAARKERVACERAVRIAMLGADKELTERVIKAIQMRSQA